MGLSQGAWVSLIAAERDKRVSFLIWLSGPPMTPAQQGAEIVRIGMLAKGWDEGSIQEAIALHDAVLEVYRADAAWEEGAAKVDAARKKAWFKDGGTELQPRDSWNWRWYASFFDYDPVPGLRSLTRPLLAIYGAEDQIVPATTGQRVIDGLPSSGPATKRSCVLEGVGHDLGGRDAEWPADYWIEIKRFLTDQQVLN
jgi:pimeloyl-ACP methyl ester carboxylesterase